MPEPAEPLTDPGQPSGPAAMPEHMAQTPVPSQRRANDELGDPFQKYEDTERGQQPAPAKSPKAATPPAPAKTPAPAKSATPAPAKSPVAPPKNPAPPKQATAPAKTPVAPPKQVAPPADNEGKPKETEQEPPPGESFNGPKALREAYDRLHGHYKAVKAEVEQFRSSGRTKAEPAYAELQAKHKELEERYKAIDAEMRFIDYEKSSEFKEQFHAPYIKTWQEATSQLRDYRALNADGTERAPTAEDLTAVVRAQSTPEARRIAKEIFGEDDAQDIVNLRAKIIEKHRQMEEAKADFRTKGSERAAQQQREMEEASTQAEAQWNRLNSEAVEKYPEWFKADEGDDKGAELLKEGFELADRAWDGRGMKPDELLRLRSAMRNRAGAFRYVAHKLETQKSRIAELEAKLAEYEQSEPGGEKPPGEEGAPAGGDPLGDPFAKYAHEEQR